MWGRFFIVLIDLVGDGVLDVPVIRRMTSLYVMLRITGSSRTPTPTIRISNYFDTLQPHNCEDGLLIVKIKKAQLSVKSWAGIPVRKHFQGNIRLD